MSEAYRVSRKVREHMGANYGKVPEGDRSRRKLGEGTGSVKKYLATTMGRGLDMRSLIEKEESAVR
jgi:hypothetical protein